MPSRFLFINLVLYLALLTISPSSQAAAKATRLTASNAAELQQRGPDAWGGVGDWHLSNGTLCATISDISHESDLSAQGGSLIDLGYCGRADDQVVVFHDLLDGSTSRPLGQSRIEALQTADSAAIRVFSQNQGLLVETTFRTDPLHPTQLQIHKRIRRQNADAQDFFAYVPVFFNYFSMQTFVLDSKNLQQSTGFKHQGFFDRGISAFGAAAAAADTIIAIGAPGARVPIAYGWQLRSAQRVQLDTGETARLTTFALSDQGSTVFLIPAEEFLLTPQTSPGLLQLAQLPTMGLAPGQEIRLHETLYIGANSDVGAITDQLFATAPVLHGQVSDAQAVVHLDKADGTPVSFDSPYERPRATTSYASVPAVIAKSPPP